VQRAGDIAKYFFSRAEYPAGGQFLPLYRTYTGIINNPLLQAGANIDVAIWEDVGAGPKSRIARTGGLGFAPIIKPAPLTLYLAGQMLSGNLDTSFLNVANAIGGTIPLRSRGQLPAGRVPLVSRGSVPELGQTHRNPSLVGGRQESGDAQGRHAAAPVGRHSDRHECGWQWTEAVASQGTGAVAVPDDSGTESYTSFWEIPSTGVLAGPSCADINCWRYVLVL
jgi:hypothetical protein